jgi:hypothetical protein
MKLKDRCGLVLLIIIVVVCGLFVLAMIGAYNDIGPVKFLGGYLGFPEVGIPGQREGQQSYQSSLNRNPSSAEVTETETE